MDYIERCDGMEKGPWRNVMHAFCWRVIIFYSGLRVDGTDPKRWFI